MIIREKAQKPLRELLDSRPGKIFTLLKQNYGCRGPRILLAMEKPREELVSCEVDGFRFQYEEAIAHAVDRLVIDYGGMPFNKGLILK